MNDRRKTYSELLNENDQLNFKVLNLEIVINGVELYISTLRESSLTRVNITNKTLIKHQEYLIKVLFK